MLEKFRDKLKNSSEKLQKNIRLHIGDMSNFDLGQKFELIIIPWRALQWLPTREKTVDCFNCVYEHLSDDGILIFDIFKPRTYDEKWLGREELSYDIVDGERRIVRSTINHYADNEKKYIQYKNRILISENGSERIAEDLLTLKYYHYDDIVEILNDQRFKIREEFGYYDKRTIKDGEEMIFVCTK
jgi:hypothetical protein